MSKPHEIEVKAWLMIGRHHYEALREIEHTLMKLVGETEEGGHVGDFLYGGNIDAKELIRKTKARNKRLGSASQ